MLTIVVVAATAALLLGALTRARSEMAEFQLLAMLAGVAFAVSTLVVCPTSVLRTGESAVLMSLVLLGWLLNELVETMLPTSQQARNGLAIFRDIWLILAGTRKRITYAASVLLVLRNLVYAQSHRPVILTVITNLVAVGLIMVLRDRQSATAQCVVSGMMLHEAITIYLKPAIKISPRAHRPFFAGCVCLVMVVLIADFT